MNTLLCFRLSQKVFFAFVLVLCTLFCNLKIFAQIDTLALPPLGRMYETRIEHGSNGGLKHYILTGPQAHTQSEKIQLYFEDIAWNTNVGFDDPTLGPEYVDVAVCTFEYIESVINMANVSDTAPIRIYFESSDISLIDTICPPSFASADEGFAWGRILYDSAFISSINPNVLFSGGFLYDHIVNGTPTAANYQYDGIMAINLQSGYFSARCDGQTDSCMYDLFSVILHEATHLLGFGSSLWVIPDTAGLQYYPYNPVALFSTINPNNRRFTIYDREFLYFYNAGGIFTKLVDTNGINPAMDINSICSNSIWLTNTPFTGSNKTNQPVYSRNTFAPGTTLHHFDNSYRNRAYQSPQFVPDYIMSPDAKPEHHYVYTRQELRALALLGSLGTIGVHNFLYEKA